MPLTVGSPKLRFAFALVLLATFRGGPAQANPSCDQFFQETKARTELETLQAVQALVPRDQYRISKNDVLTIATELGLSVEETHFELARVAATRKSTPLSNFGVGAAGVSKEGEVFLGANVEFRGTALGLTLHSERTVLLLANDAGVKIEKLYSTVTPCGGCRQWLNEIEGGANLQVISKGQDGVLFSKTLGELLPLDFGPWALGQKGLMDPNQARSHLGRVPIIVGGLNRAQLNALVGATESSYAPYTRSPAGALIQLKDGRFVTGSYIEAVGYESYSPVAVAVAKLKMMAVASSEITAIYMMWAPSPGAGHVVDHEAQAAALVKSIADEKFDGAGAEIAFRSIVLAPRD